MKFFNFDSDRQNGSRFVQILEDFSELRTLWRRQRLSQGLFWALCLNLILAPAVLAATDESFTKSQAYWLSALLLVTIALSVYLFWVMFAPEKF
jgi:hypothetical protein